MFLENEVSFNIKKETEKRVYTFMKGYNMPQDYYSIFLSRIFVNWLCEWREKMLLR